MLHQRQAMKTKNSDGRDDRLPALPKMRSVTR